MELDPDFDREYRRASCNRLRADLKSHREAFNRACIDLFAAKGANIRLRDKLAVEEARVRFLRVLLITRERCAGGTPPALIADELNATGHRTRNGNAWTAKGVESVMALSAVSEPVPVSHLGAGPASADSSEFKVTP